MKIEAIFLNGVKYLLHWVLSQFKGKTIKIQN